MLMYWLKKVNAVYCKLNCTVWVVAVHHHTTYSICTTVIISEAQCVLVFFWSTRFYQIIPDVNKITSLLTCTGDICMFFLCCPSDLESTLSPLESVLKFESLLWKIWDPNNWWCEQAGVIGETLQCHILLYHELHLSETLLLMLRCKNPSHPLSSLSPL